MQRHASSQLRNGNLVNNGVVRPGVCFSRAICYELNRDATVERVAWQFEAPFALPADGGDDAAAPAYSKADWRHAMTHDEYNFDGGSVHPLPSGTVLAAFTATYPTRAYNRNASAFIWEVDPRVPVAESVRSLFIVPHSGSDTGEGLWRVVPWHTIYGEGTTPTVGV